MLQRQPGFFRGFDGIVMRLEVTVHHQRIAFGRGLVGADDSLALLRFVEFELRLLHLVSYEAIAPAATDAALRQDRPIGMSCEGNGPPDTLVSER
jgi:hypothetical protein